MTQDATVALERAYTPDGLNVGMNLGRSAGAGIPGHLHVHALPRWNGDTNFMTSVAEARVLPEPLRRSWEKLKAGWPERSGSRSTGEHNREASDHETEPDGDVLPEELDVTAYVGPYLFPSTRRRRIAGTMYAVVALLCLLGWLASDNGGLLAAAMFLALVAAYHFSAAWPLSIDQTEALLVASRRSGSPSATRARSSRRTACARGRRGGSSSTAPTNRRRYAGSSSSTASTATCSASTPNRTPRTGRSSG